MDNIEKRNRSQTEEDVQLLSEKKKTPAESRLSNQGCFYTFTESSSIVTTLLRVAYPIVTTETSQLY